MKHKYITLVSCTIIAVIAIMLFYRDARFLSQADAIRFEEKAKTSAQEMSTSIARNLEQTEEAAFRMTRSILAGNRPGNPGFDPEYYVTDLFDGLFIHTREIGDFFLTDPVHGRFESDPEIMRQAKTLYQEWHSEAKDREIMWQGPVLDSVDEHRVAYQIIPMTRKDFGVNGFMMFSFRITKAYNYFQQQGANRYGMVYMMDRETRFIAHPLDENRTLRELGHDFKDQVLIDLADDLKNDRLKSDYVHRNTITGLQCTEYICPVENTPWVLGLSIYNGRSLESLEYRTEMKKSTIRSVFYGAISILCIWLLLSILNSNLRRSLWYCFIIPLVALTAITFIIRAYNRYPDDREDTLGSDEMAGVMDIGERVNPLLKERGIPYKWDPQQIIDQKTLDEFIEWVSWEPREEYGEIVKLVPTGYYLTSLQFTASNEIRLIGFYWQKYLIAEDDEILPEKLQKYHNHHFDYKGVDFFNAQVNLNEMVDSIPTLLEGHDALAYRWKFNIEISQNLSYKLYPFGKNIIKLTVWNNDLDGYNILVPDLESYKQTYPDDNPGLDNSFKINGWDISGSYYSYRLVSYLCTFGNSDLSANNRFPELSFNISVSRKFIDILVCKIIPLFVVLVILFTTLFVRQKDDGFNNIIGCSGLFFVLVIDHINLRENTLSEGVMYLEYFYFFAYLLLMIITLTSFSTKYTPQMQHYSDSVDFFLKRYYWGIVMGLLFLATLFTFY